MLQRELRGHHGEAKIDVEVLRVGAAGGNAAGDC